MSLSTSLARCWQPSLARRVMLALLAAFALVAIVLAARDYLQFSSGFWSAPDSPLIRFAASIHAALEEVADEAEARDLVRATDMIFNRSRAESGVTDRLLFELRRSDGKRVYASPGLAALPLDAIGDRPTRLSIGGVDHRVADAAGPRWRLLMAEPRIEDESALKLIAADLVPSMLIALPLVVLPVWFAVRQGLRPLRQLSRRLAQRHDGEDRSPLGVDMRYAELKPVVIAFDELLARLRAKVARERAFVQDAAHELRTPMAVIAAQAHVLAQAAGEAERAQAKGSLEQAIARASHLAQQLLALASLDAARPVQRLPIDLAHWLQTTLAQAMPLAQQREIELSLDVPETLPFATELPALHSMVLNLLDNALRYGRCGGQVAVSLRPAPEHIELQMADDGAGISPADRARIFERFARGAGQDAPGTGLGLAIVRQAVERLHGAISVGDGIDGRGVSFVVRLPRDERGSGDAGGLI